MLSPRITLTVAKETHAPQLRDSSDKEKKPKINIAERVSLPQADKDGYHTQVYQKASDCAHDPERFSIATWKQGLNIALKRHVTEGGCERRAAAAARRAGAAAASGRGDAACAAVSR